MIEEQEEPPRGLTQAVPVIAAPLVVVAPMTGFRGSGASGEAQGVQRRVERGRLGEPVSSDVTSGSSVASIVACLAPWKSSPALSFRSNRTRPNNFNC